MREHTVDATNQILTEIWSFGVGDWVYRYQMGEPHRLANGNAMHNTGALARGHPRRLGRVGSTVDQ